MQFSICNAVTIAQHAIVHHIFDKQVQDTIEAGDRPIAASTCGFRNRGSADPAKRRRRREAKQKFAPSQLTSGKYRKFPPTTRKLISGARQARERRPLPRPPIESNWRSCNLPSPSGIPNLNGEWDDHAKHSSPQMTGTGPRSRFCERGQVAYWGRVARDGQTTQLPTTHATCDFPPTYRARRAKRSQRRC